MYHNQYIYELKPVKILSIRANITEIFWRGPSCCVLSNIYYISTVNTQHMENQLSYYNWVVPAFYNKLLKER